jgi:hypothetical protein
MMVPPFMLGFGSLFLITSREGLFENGGILAGKRGWRLYDVDFVGIAEILRYTA